MRVQEHLFQGFFGGKKKKDALKYYKERVEKLKQIDSKLDSCIFDFQRIANDHKKNLARFNAFIKNPTTNTLAALKQEISTLENLTGQDEEVNEAEERHVLQIKTILDTLMKEEDSEDLKLMEKETLDELHELDKLLCNIECLWEVQLEFVKKEDVLILSDIRHSKVLGDIMKEEADILAMEEQLLRKINLKLGNILRKTTLKLKEIEEAKDSNLQYREIKYAR